MDSIRVDVKFTAGTHIARAAGKSASSTAGWEQAVRALQEKLGISPECPARLFEVAAASRQVWEIDCAAAPGTREYNLQVLRLALEIADDAARADVECNAVEVEAEGGPAFDLSRGQAFRGDLAADVAAARERAARAARYIELRGPDVFDYQFVRLQGDLVAFRAKDA